MHKNETKKLWQLCKKIFTFGAAKVKCQQRVQVFQSIWTNYDPIEMLKKVWLEDAWELNFQSYFKSVSQEILCSKKSIFTEFVKHPLDVWSIFTNFLVTEIKNQRWSWIPKNLGTISSNFYRNSQKSPGDPECSP